jgi:hypothetical protein
VRGFGYSLSSLRDRITKLDVLEALAALKATHLCNELGFYKVVLKGDTL